MAFKWLNEMDVGLMRHGKQQKNFVTFFSKVFCVFGF